MTKSYNNYIDPGSSTQLGKDSVKVGDRELERDSALAARVRKRVDRAHGHLAGRTVNRPVIRAVRTPLEERSVVLDKLCLGGTERSELIGRLRLAGVLFLKAHVLFHNSSYESFSYRESLAKHIAKGRLAKDAAIGINFFQGFFSNTMFRLVSRRAW